MYYLLLIIYSSNGGLTSQKIPVESLSSCKAKMEVFDDTKLLIQGYIGPSMRAYCIKGVK